MAKHYDYKIEYLGKIIIFIINTTTNIINIIMTK